MKLIFKLGFLVLALYVAFALAIALFKLLFQPVVAAYVAAAAALAFAVCAAYGGFKHGSGEAAWKGGLDGVGWVFKTIISIMKTIVRLVFGLIKGVH